MGIAIVSVVGQLILIGKEGLLLEEVSQLAQEVIPVFVKFKGEVGAADHGLDVGDIFADERIDQVVPFEESNCVVDIFLEFEGILMLFFPSAHEIDELADIPLDEEEVAACRVLELSVVFHLHFFELLNFFLSQDPLSLLIHLIIMIDSDFKSCPISLQSQIKTIKLN